MAALALLTLLSASVSGTLSALHGAGSASIASEPRGLTPDGAIVAGKVAHASNFEAARWTIETGRVARLSAVSPVQRTTLTQLRNVFRQP